MNTYRNVTGKTNALNKKQKEMKETNKRDKQKNKCILTLMPLMHAWLNRCRLLTSVFCFLKGKGKKVKVSVLYIDPKNLV